MKQAIGVLIVLASLIALVFFTRLIYVEVEASKAHKEIITQGVELNTEESIKPLTLVDRNGSIYSEEYVEWRQPIAFDEVPNVVKQIYLYSEDEFFYNHIGFDVSAIARAVVANSTNESQQGGSTLTQQLVRMRYLSADKTYERKLMELFYAYELEKQYTKQEIFEMYLNETYYANQVYGIQSAASFYFSKSLQELTIAEIAFIAAIPNNPSMYDPLEHFDQTKARQERLLDTLANHKVISDIEATDLKQAPIVLSVKQKQQNAPAYTTFVLNELKELIATQEGLSAKTEAEAIAVAEQVNIRYTQLLQSGATIYTALDPVKQKQDEASINTIMKQYDFQASATVIDNQTREIVSIYPGKDYQKFDYHRAFQSYRQPGSSFKPIAAYAPFINETGYNENYIVSGGAYCVGNYCPSNYGGGIYGDVTLLTALKNSYNTSALRLIYRTGLNTSYQYVEQFDFEKINEQEYTYAAALGGLKYGVTTTELANAYTSFIDGSFKKARSIRQVVDQDGNVIYDWQTSSIPIWHSKTVKSMRSLLHEVVNSGTAQGLQASGSYIGAKTGTTNDYNDFWLAGLSDQYTTAIWIGYDEPKSMEAYEKSKVHFKIFNAIMN